jgi:ribonucleotide reductase alpha subunit
LEILRARYFQRDESGALIKNLDGMFERVARAVAAPSLRWPGC